MSLDVHERVPERGGARIAWATATLVGVALGVACVISPASVWCLVIAALLIVWSGQGLDGRERRAVVGLVTFSIVMRLIVVALFFLATDHGRAPWGVMIGDERQILERSEWLRNIAVGVELAPTDWGYAFQEYGNSGLPYVFAYMNALLGISPYGAHLMNVLFAVGGTVVLHKVLRRSYGPAPAFGAALLLLFTPTLVVWSVSALKESSFFFLVAVALASLQVAVYGRWLLLRAVAVVCALAAMNGVAAIRPVGWAVCAGGFAVGAAARVATRRAWICLGCILIGGGVAFRLLQRPHIQTRILNQFRITAVIHIGNVKTEGYAYKLLDPHYYTRWAAENNLSFMTLDDVARYAVRAVSSFATVPTPWQVVSRPALAFLPEQVLWYVALVLAVVGIVAGLRRDTWLTFFLAGYCMIGAAVISLPSGNIGTFIRMRDMVLPYVLCLSALGGCVVLDAAARRIRGRGDRVADIRSKEWHAIAR